MTVGASGERRGVALDELEAAPPPRKFTARILTVTGTPLDSPEIVNDPRAEPNAEIQDPPASSEYSYPVMGAPPSLEGLR